jgi:hypothetical protein
MENPVIVLIAVASSAVNSTSQALPSVGLASVNVIVAVAILIYFLLLCIYDIPIIGTTIIPNPQSPNHNGLFASVSTT